MVALAPNLTQRQCHRLPRDDLLTSATISAVLEIACYIKHNRERLLAASANRTMITTSIQALLHEDKLDEAIAAMEIEVRNHAACVDRRAVLAELLCFAGSLERADVILDAISDIDPGTAVGVAMFRRLIRAEQARQQFYTEGRLPEFQSRPDPRVELELRAASALRAGSVQEANALLAQRETVRQPTRGMADEAVFEDFRDLDDRSKTLLQLNRIQFQNATASV